MSAADPRIETLTDMGQCARRLGMAFGAESEQATDMAKKVEFFRLFDRCFFSVRVAMALEARLSRLPAERPEPRSDRETLIEREDLVDREPPERPEAYTEADREQDRESEHASFPVLLKTLEGVAADAQSLPGPKPAELPTLRELLVRVKSHPTTAAPGAKPSLRARLAGSGAAPVAAGPERRPASNVGEVLARKRRATGPPRR